MSNIIVPPDQKAEEVAKDSRLKGSRRAATTGRRGSTVARQGGGLKSGDHDIRQDSKSSLKANVFDVIDAEISNAGTRTDANDDDQDICSICLDDFHGGSMVQP